MMDKQKYLKELISKVKRLTIKEKHHILSIFKKYDIEYTKNSNGYFFNLDKIDNDILDKVFKCIELIEEKRELITILDKKRDVHLEYYKNLIENKLKETIHKKRVDYINKLILTPSNICIKKKVENKILKFSNLDPDILMKEHNKNRKYEKNSIKYRINKKIMLMSKKSHKYTSDKLSNDDNWYDDDDNDIDIDDEYIDDIGDVEDELKEDIDEEYLNDCLDNDDYIENSEIIDDEMYDDEYYKYNDSDSELNTETEKSERTDNRTKCVKLNKKKKDQDVEASSNEIDYYKSLLKQNGFKFDDDKNVQIKIEEYIQ